MPNANKDEELRQEIARRAYLRCCDRGCSPGADVDDWLAAEREVRCFRRAREFNPAQEQAAPPAQSSVDELGMAHACAD